MVKIKKCFIVLLLFSTIFLGSFVISSGDVSALEDISITYDSSSPQSYSGSQIFGSLISSYSQYISYSYLNITISPLSLPLNNNEASYTRLGIGMDCGTPLYSLPLVSNSSIPVVDLSSPCTRNKTPFFTSGINWSSFLSSGQSITFTLSETSIFSSPSSSPSGTLSITSNGTFNVSSYEFAEVDVPSPPVVTPYDGKLDSLIQAVYTVGAVMLVIYFFFALYRLYIGGKT